jgi:phosphoenolpyruvate synthase/pyruvate phosphate dikinase
MRSIPASLDQLLHPTIDPKAPRDVIATGLPASPGAASGEIVFTADEAERLAGRASGHPGARSRPARRTSTACTPPKASSPRAAA